MNPSEKINLKEQLKAECIRLLELRLQNSRQAMNRAQEAANEEEKSSAGDKYETGRAVSQLDRDMNARQMEEVQRELAIVLATDVKTVYNRVTTGAYISCTAADFFVAAGLGKILVDGKTIIALSPKAPLAIAMQGKGAGQKFIFLNKEFEINTVY
jgi:hypothetical protein